MSEMELTVDHLVVIGEGRRAADTTMADFIDRNSQAVTVVRSPQADRLKALLEAGGGRGDRGHRRELAGQRAGRRGHR